MLLYTTTYYIIQLSSFTRGEMKWVVGFGVQGSGFRVVGCGGAFAANIYEAMPEGCIQVTSHRSLGAPNP